MDETLKHEHNLVGISTRSFALDFALRSMGGAAIPPDAMDDWFVRAERIQAWLETAPAESESSR